jgi:hypothetical protein
MRRLICMSADVYCQTTNNHFYTTPAFLYSNRKKGKRASCKETERESVCERRRVAKNGVGVCCKNSCWKKDELF